MPVSWSDLEDAFMVLGGDDSASGFLNTKTGEIFLRFLLTGLPAGGLVRL